MAVHVEKSSGSHASGASLDEKIRRSPVKAWTVVVLLVFFQIIAFADKAVLGLVAPYAMPELGLTPTEFGFIGSAFFFLYAIVSVIVGIIATRVKVSWIVFALGLTWAVMQFPMLFGGGAAVLLATRIILGGAEGPATAMSLTSAHTWFAPARRALPSSLIAMGSTLGPVFAAPFIAWVISMWGWRWAFGALGIIGFVWLVAWAVFGGDGPYRANRKASEESDLAAKELSDDIDPRDRRVTVDDQKPVNIWAALFSVAFIAALLGAATNFWVQGFLTTWLPQYLSVVEGFSLSQVGIFTTFPWVFGALVLLFIGWLGQQLMKRGFNAHIGLAVPFGVSTMTAGLSFLLVPVAPSNMSVLLLTIAGGCSLVFPMCSSAIGYAVGPKQRPILLATLGGFAAFGAIISPVLVGSLMSKAGYVPTPKGQELTPENAAAMADGVNTAFMITGSILVVGGLIAALLLRPEALGAKLQAKHVKA